MVYISLSCATCILYIILKISLPDTYISPHEGKKLKKSLLIVELLYSAYILYLRKLDIF